MKTKLITRLSSFLMTFFLAALVSVSAVMCFAETFKLGCEFTVLLPAGCGIALTVSLGMLTRRRWIAAVSEAAVLAAVILWKWPLMTEGVQRVLFQITSQYAKDFPVKITGSGKGDALWIMLVLAAVLAWVTAWVCSGKGSAIPVALVCAPIFVSCLLVVDIAPVLWLLLLTGALFLLFMTQSVRSHDPGQGNRLAWLLLLPSALLIFAVVRLAPPEEYVRMEWSDVLREIGEARLDLQKNPLVAPVTDVRWNRQLDQVSLRWMGPKRLTGKHALDFRSSSAISYLRGVSLGVYENNTWKAIKSRNFAAQQFVEQPQITGNGNSESLEVRTESRRPQLYTAYYLSEIPEGVDAVDDAYLENGKNKKEYTISYSTGVRRPSGEYDVYVAEHYTQLPENLREPLEQYVRDNGLRGRSAREIADHVQRTGRYDLNASQVPMGEDFVLYFLNESKRGYCVHFASAAVLLLRTEGIPARYVTGYAVSGTPGEWNAVTEDEAHAWVEYYQVGVGWRTLDPTPPDWRTATNDTAAQPNEPDEPDEPQMPEADREPVREEPKAETPSMQKPQSEVALPSVGNVGPGTVPSTGGTAVAVGEKFMAVLQKVLLYMTRWLLPPLAVLLVIVLRRRLVVRYRHNQCTRGHPNRCLLAYWRWLVKLSKTAGSPLDSELLALAEKARFSQHTIREDELVRFQQAVGEEVKKLRASSAIKRLWHQYGRVLY